MSETCDKQVHLSLCLSSKPWVSIFGQYYGGKIPMARRKDFDIFGSRRVSIELAASFVSVVVALLNIEIISRFVAVAAARFVTKIASCHQTCLLSL